MRLRPVVGILATLALVTTAQGPAGAALYRERMYWSQYPATDVAVDPAAGRVLVSISFGEEGALEVHEGRNTVHRVGLSGGRPEGVAVDPDAAVAYVAGHWPGSSSPSTLWLVDLAAPPTLLQAVSLPPRAIDIALDETTGLVAVAHQNGLSVVDPDAASSSYVALPESGRVEVLDGTAFVIGSSTLLAVDLSSLAVRSVPSVGGYSTDLAAGGGEVFVASPAARAVQVYDAASLAHLRSLSWGSLGGPRSIAFDAVRGTIATADVTTPRDPDACPGGRESRVVVSTPDGTPTTTGWAHFDPGVQCTDGELARLVALDGVVYGWPWGGAVIEYRDDVVPPETAFTTTSGSPVWRLGLTTLWLRGRSNDATAGVADVHLRFEHRITGAVTEYALSRTSGFSCGATGRSCVWQTAPPDTPGPYRVTARAIDRAGNVEPDPPSIEILVI